MMAAYRLRGLGWFVGCVGMVLGFYLVSLQVAHERNRLEALNRRIAGAERDIRALETEFDTRANLQQLERWNGDILALSAPTAGQFVRDGGQLAAVRFDAGAAPAGEGEVRMAALVVPSLPVAPPPAPVAQPAVVQVAVASAPAVRAVPARAAAGAAPAPVRMAAARTAPAPLKAAFARIAPAPVKVAAVRTAAKPQPKAAKIALASATRVPQPIDLLAEVRTRPAPRQAPARAQRVAMIDGVLLSDLGARARAEASRR